jgi:catechol 2,3-dioxygenase-like lactoylglutathione lyase family enzyme
MLDDTTRPDGGAMKQSWLQRAGMVLAIVSAAGAAMGQQARPRITGISHLCVYATDRAAGDHFYADILGGIKGSDPENPLGVRYYFSATQYAEVLPLPANASISRMDHVAFNTDDAAGLLAYMKGHGGTGLTELHHGADGSAYFESKDPEGNTIQFVQPGNVKLTSGSEPQVSQRIIHIGFLVHDRKTEDRFYKDLLGFRPYWYGAMKPDKVDWVSQQVPDGHDWLEYMLVGDGTDTPVDHVDQRELGVLNHFSLGVPNMEQAMTVLFSADRLPPRHDGPQMGKDGKWQANFYDPDDTRVEFMEFKPVMKPCCSGFTADSPAN